MPQIRRRKHRLVLDITFAEETSIKAAMGYIRIRLGLTSVDPRVLNDSLDKVEVKDFGAVLRGEKAAVARGEKSWEE